MIGTRFWKRYRWFGKSDHGETDCPECRNLHQEEADAAIELVAADEAPPMNVSSLENQRIASGRAASKDRLRDARDRLDAHRKLHHPSQFVSLQAS